jgi:hypothetical protein
MEDKYSLPIGGFFAVLIKALLCYGLFAVLSSVPDIRLWNKLTLCVFTYYVGWIAGLVKAYVSLKLKNPDLKTK